MLLLELHFDTKKTSCVPCSGRSSKQGQHCNSWCKQKVRDGLTFGQGPNPWLWKAKRIVLSLWPDLFERRYFGSWSHHQRPCSSKGKGGHGRLLLCRIKHIRRLRGVRLTLLDASNGIIVSACVTLSNLVGFLYVPDFPCRGFCTVQPTRVQSMSALKASDAQLVYFLLCSS